jgi:hypothetical protein
LLQFRNIFLQFAQLAKPLATHSKKACRRAAKTFSLSVGTAFRKAGSNFHNHGE